MCGKTPIFKFMWKYDKDTSFNLAQSTTWHLPINTQGPKTVLFAIDTDIQVKAL